MSHAYNNFYTAYYNLRLYWDSGQYLFDYLESETTWALTEWNAGDDHAAIGHLINCAANTAGIFNATAQYRGADAYHSELLETMYWGFRDASKKPEYKLTWKAICEAWAKDDFEGKEWTIAIIDHMRKLMWDKPFRIVWASKPKSEAE